MTEIVTPFVDTYNSKLATYSRMCVRVATRQHGRAMTSPTR